MSKYVKDLMANDLRDRLEGVGELLVVNVIGLNSERTAALRSRFRERKMNLAVVKNSVARRATEGTVLAPAFEGLDGASAVVWGGSDVVSLAKEVVAIAKDDKFAPFAARGGVMDGAALTSDDVTSVSKWPSREEQLSILLGQILSPGASLSSQLISVGGALASQIKQKGEEEEAEGA